MNFLDDKTSMQRLNSKDTGIASHAADEIIDAYLFRKVVSSVEATGDERPEKIWYANGIDVDAKLGAKARATKSTGVEKKLMYYKKGKPKLKLDPLENTFIYTLNQKDYDILKQIFESAGWKYLGKKDATGNNFFLGYSTPSLSVNPLFVEGGFEDFLEMDYNKFISDKEFYNIQGVTQKMREEIYSWYEMNKPNRASKGVLF